MIRRVLSVRMRKKSFRRNSSNKEKSSEAQRELSEDLMFLYVSEGYAGSSSLRGLRSAMTKAVMKPKRMRTMEMNATVSVVDTLAGR